MEANPKSIFYPPGGILMWIIIYLELITFGIAMVVFAYYGAQERTSFHADSQLLNKGIATANTILLLTSGFFVAKGIQNFKQRFYNKTANQFLIGILCGFGFLILKVFEYYAKYTAGLDMGHNQFFMFYWLLTGFHWIHVLVGLLILLVIRRGIIKKKENASLEDIEAGASFWHMCDIIWILLFPLIYLIF